jgi:hypothetical protein
MPEKVILLNVTSETEPVAPETVLMRTALSDLVTVEEEISTVFTTLSVRPPTEPMERPCPPVQVPPVKVMSYMIVSAWADENRQAVMRTE